MPSKPTVVTLGSHSALQIAKGAHDEGLNSCVVITPKNSSFYRRYKFIDQILEIPEFSQFKSLEKKLRKLNPVIIPHGSFVAHLGYEANKSMNLPYFGNKYVLDFEFDRLKQRLWMEEADVLVPKQFTAKERIDRTVIVKTYGASGGSGYFLAKDKTDFAKKIKKMKGQDFLIQEYVVGVPMYIHYFHSPLTNTLEILSVDRRYETNVDGLGRLPLQHQDGLLNPTFTVVGNSPLSVRESLLPELYAMGERVVKTSQKLISPKGLFGPFCLETIIDENQQFYVIEISARIVAGTNLFIQGSPYSDLLYDEPMSTGRRIAREIKLAHRKKQLHVILHKD